MVLLTKYSCSVLVDIYYNEYNEYLPKIPVLPISYGDAANLMK